MKKIIFILIFCLTILTTTNTVYANAKMVSITGDYKLNFTVMNPYTFKFNDFYAGIQLKYIYLHEKIVYVDGWNEIDVSSFELKTKGILRWENPEYILCKGGQLINMIYTKKDGKEIKFTMLIDCDKSFIEVAKPLIK